MARVYPRVCGGTPMGVRAGVLVIGLSPRVRGNRRHTPPMTNTPRSIPACAGEPSTPTVLAVLQKVYPRVCGGTPSLNSIRYPVAGLSPRVRGNQFFDVHDSLRERSIPACAGEPFRVMTRLSVLTVYPRVCGGTGMSACDLGTQEGLSPRVRGNHGQSPPNRQLLRSIPACAGEPRPGCLPR